MKNHHNPINISHELRVGHDITIKTLHYLTIDTKKLEYQDPAMDRPIQRPNTTRTVPPAIRVAGRGILGIQVSRTSVVLKALSGHTANFKLLNSIWHYSVTKRKKWQELRA